MDENNLGSLNNSSAVNNVSEVKRPLVSPLVIVICLGLIFFVLLAVYIFVPGKESFKEVKKIERKVNLVVSPTVSPGIQDAPLSTSDNISDIEKDVNNTDVSSLDSELSSIEAELSQ